MIASITNSKAEIAVFGGGCFWCTEAVFSALNGVSKVESGYSGGSIDKPTYQDVSSGQSGHAEVIKITYDPQIITFQELLEVFFLTHDPTTLNRQGADVGTQYRSAIFYTNPDQKQLALKVIQKLNEEKAYPHPIVTEVSELKKYFPAEAYHQNYFDRNENQPYCKFVIQPKMEKFEKSFKHLIKK